MGHETRLPIKHSFVASCVPTIFMVFVRSLKMGLTNIRGDVNRAFWPYQILLTYSFLPLKDVGI